MNCYAVHQHSLNSLCLFCSFNFDHLSLLVIVVRYRKNRGQRVIVLHRSGLILEELFYLCAWSVLLRRVVRFRSIQHVLRAGCYQ